MRRAFSWLIARPRLILSIMLLLFAAGLWYRMNDVAKPKELSVDELYRTLEADEIAELNIDAESGIVTGKLKDQNLFESQVANRDLLESKAVAKGVKVTAKPVKASWGSVLFSFFIWWLIISGFIILTLWVLSKIFKGRGGINDDIKNFGSIKVTVLKPQERYKDVAGCDEAIVELKEVVDCLSDPRKFERFGVRTPRGILLVGPPGTGKTLLAKATAGEARIPLIPLSGSEFDEALVGIGASRIRDAFAEAKKRSPCIIFIDEFDAVGRRRTLGGFSSGTHDQTLNQLLAEMDGFKSDKQVIVMAATNQPEVLDPAVVRPGRFDRKVMVLLPDRKAREEIFKIHSRNKPLDPSVDPAEVAKSTPGFSGADLEAAINEAALLAIRDKKDSISKAEIEEGIDKVVGGGKKKNTALSKKDLEKVAYHEAGHTLTTKLCPKADPLRKVTILAMGMSGGSTWHKTDEDDVLKTEQYFKDRLTVLIGGRAAESVKYGEISVGARGDIVEATRLAKSMVCDYGFSKDVGHVSHGQSSQFLGIASDSLNCSEETKNLIDMEVRKLIDGAYSRAVELLKANENKLDAIASALLERETLMDSDVDEIVAGCSNPT